MSSTNNLRERRQDESTSNTCLLCCRNRYFVRFVSICLLLVPSIYLGLGTPSTTPPGALFSGSVKVLDDIMIAIRAFSIIGIVFNAFFVLLYLCFRSRGSYSFNWLGCNCHGVPLEVCTYIIQQL